MSGPIIDQTSNGEQDSSNVHQGIPDAKGKKRSPWYWVPSAYFAEGIPYVVVQTLAVIMYKKLGISNTDIAYYTSWLYLPWVIKPLWSPLVDILKTKRWWIVITQFILAATLGWVAYVIPMPNYFKLSLWAFWVMAFMSATHDIACDGFYMLGLSKHQQAWYVGIRSTFYRIATIIGQGALLILVGYFEAKTGIPGVEMNVKVNPKISENKVQVVKYLNLSTQYKDAIEKLSPELKLDFYFEKSKTAASFEEKVNIAKEAEKVFNDLNKMPEGVDIEKAQASIKEIKDIINVDIEKQITDMSASIQPKEGDLRVVIMNPDVVLPISNIASQDTEMSSYLTKKWNAIQGPSATVNIAPARLKNGEKASMWKSITGGISTAWNTVIVKPTEWVFVSIWGKYEKSTSKTTGAFDYIYIHLSKAPAPEQEITVLFGQKSGKSVELTEGSRFIFSDKNWNKPARAMITADYRLKTEGETIFAATAGNIPKSWSLTYYVLCGLFVFFAFYHYIILPYPKSDFSRYEEAKLTGKPVRIIDLLKEFIDIFITYFQKPGIVLAITYLLLYRFSEAQLVKIGPVFLVDSRENGGLAMSNEAFGLAYGIFGKLGLTIGGILGGFLAARAGLKKWIWPMAMAITLPHIVFVYYAFAQPEHFWNICLGVTFESFGYGFGFAAYMLYMIYISDGKYKTAHFALSTAFMALSMMIPGMFCGWIQELIGYGDFFVYIMIMSVTTWIVVPFIKIDPEFGKKH